MVRVKITATQKHCMIAEPLVFLDKAKREPAVTVVNNTVRLRNNGPTSKPRSSDSRGNTGVQNEQRNSSFQLMVFPLIFLVLTLAVRIIWMVI